jgi:uncharacterized membrane protein YjjB (DUF3815 family)
MDVMPLGVKALWAGLFASSLGMLFTAPPRYFASTFVCGFAGRLARDLLMDRGLTQNWSTVIAAALVALVAVAITRGHKVPPVVLVSGILPLGAATAMFSSIITLMRLSSLSGEALVDASVALSASIGTAFTISLAIALGLAAGVAVAGVVWRGTGREGV